MCDVKRCRDQQVDIGYVVDGKTRWLCNRCWDRLAAMGVTLTAKWFKPWKEVA